MHRIHVVLELGNPEPLLDDCAKHHEVDLVVLGTGGVSGLRKVFLRSIGEALLRRADCDVMFVRAGVTEGPIQDRR